MKILIHSYNTCFQNPSGGVQVRIKKIKELLTENGVTVDYFNPTVSKIAEYDILHCFKLDAENVGLITNAKNMGKKIVLSPIINLTGQRKIDFYTKFLNKFPIATTYRQIASIIDQTDLFMVETEKEGLFLAKHYGVSPEKIIVLPNGVDNYEEMMQFEGEQIFDALGKKCRYFLSVGRINPNKNNLNLINALGPTGKDLVFIGGPDKINGNHYYTQCVELAKKYPNIHFLGWAENNSDLLKSAYKNAEVVVLPSYQETFGLVLLEGGIAGAKLAISNSLPILDYDVFKRCRSFNPNKIEDIRNELLLAYDDIKDDSLQKQLIKEFSWDSIIQKQIQYYEELLNEEDIS